MAFVNYEFYKNLYGADAVAEDVFERVAFLAERKLRDYTTGVDSVCKLDVAYPTKPEDVEAVARCLCEIVNTMSAVNTAQANAQNGNVVASMSAGNESISYAVGGGMVGAVLTNIKAQDKLYADLAEQYLRGVKDANGVNLLYRGVYPFRV